MKHSLTLFLVLVFSFLQSSEYVIVLLKNFLQPVLRSIDNPGSLGAYYFQSEGSGFFDRTGYSEIVERM